MSLYTEMKCEVMAIIEDCRITDSEKQARLKRQADKQAIF